MRNVIAMIMLLWAAAFGEGCGLAAQTRIDVKSPAAVGEGYRFADGVITLLSSGHYVLEGSTDTNRVVVAQGVSANVTLSNCSIASGVAAPFALDDNGASVTLLLLGNNFLTCTMEETDDENERFCAGLQVEGSAQVVVEGLRRVNSVGVVEEGSLTVTGGYAGAGIGSGVIESNGQAVKVSTGKITINSGIITVTGGYAAAGIGGGYAGNGGTLIINDGTVTATGGYAGAGIGGGYTGNGGNITINGGRVTAVNTPGGSPGAAIGGGWEGSGGNITINGGVTLAISTDAQGGPAAIGGGMEGNAGNIILSGGAVYVYANGISPGIGQGYGATYGGSIRITGGTIIADNIGIGNGGLTPTTVGGLSTAVVTGSINTGDFGGAIVTTGANLTETLVRTMAANHIVREELGAPGDTVHDTLRITHWDTLYITIHDTVVEIRHDTVVRLIHDSVTREVYVILGGETGAEAAVAVGNLALVPCDGGELYWISGLGDGEFAVYNVSGQVIYRGAGQPVRIPGKGLFIVWQAGKYFKFIK